MLVLGPIARYWARNVGRYVDHSKCNNSEAKISLGSSGLEGRPMLWLINKSMPRVVQTHGRYSDYYLLNVSSIHYDDSLYESAVMSDTSGAV